MLHVLFYGFVLVLVYVCVPVLVFMVCISSKCYVMQLTLESVHSWTKLSAGVTPSLAHLIGK